MEHRIPERRALGLSAPRVVFFAPPGSMLPGPPQLSPSRDRSLVTAFRSPATAARFRASIPGSTLPAYYFAALTQWLPCPFGLSAPLPDPGLLPVRAASPPQARYSFPTRSGSLLPWPPLPSGIVTSLGIKAFCQLRRVPVRLPNSPDLRSLPAAFAITRFWLRINVPGSLRFRRLAVPQTSWNLHHYDPKASFGQPFFVLNSSLFNNLLFLSLQ